VIGGGHSIVTPIRSDIMPDDTTKEKPGWIQGFKEVVTALLGGAIVGLTLYLALKTFYYAGDATKYSNAKDILTIMLTVAGVVVGYYFGRVPADALAAQSQDQVKKSSAKLEIGATKIDAIIAKSIKSNTNADLVELQNLSADLRRP